MNTKEILFMYSKTILVVDDVPIFLEMAKDFFRREQVELLTAQNGPEAVKIIKTKKPNLVFMDLYMPGGDGDEACREIKNDYALKSTPIIMVTSANRPFDIEKCRKAGCDEIIHKPMTREQFLDASQKYIKFPKWSGLRTRAKVQAKYGSYSDKFIGGVLGDIGVGGLFLETEKLMPIDSELYLEFQLNQELAPIRCRGRVAWINDKTRPKKTNVLSGMGIEFIDIKKLDILSVQAWVTRGL